mmetsp:Transcript_34414/g.109544  ORF Transcript_34414/g.109544 Transcript_34414/m.109544 type:complete len:354 (-) Transcript_34414:307-1368(-)|eukprot:scaffold13524_cov109-Isochrysis_galbana.AAC.3
MPCCWNKNGRCATRAYISSRLALCAASFSSSSFLNSRARSACSRRSRRSFSRADGRSSACATFLLAAAASCSRRSSRCRLRSSSIWRLSLSISSAALRSSVDVVVGGGGTGCTGGAGVDRTGARVERYGHRRSGKTSSSRAMSRSTRSFSELEGMVPLPSGSLIASVSRSNGLGGGGLNGRGAGLNGCECDGSGRTSGVKVKSLCASTRILSRSARFRSSRVRESASCCIRGGSRDKAASLCASARTRSLRPASSNCIASHFGIRTSAGTGLALSTFSFCRAASAASAAAALSASAEARRASVLARSSIRGGSRAFATKRLASSRTRALRCRSASCISSHRRALTDSGMGRAT